MHNQPSQTELIDAVKFFISDTAIPQLTGRAAFHARIALNVLDILARDINERSKKEEAELTRLQQYLECYDPRMNINDLNALLCENISSGKQDIADPDLLELLQANAVAQIEVDQPKYSGLKTALKHSTESN